MSSLRSANLLLTEVQVKSLSAGADGAIFAVDAHGSILQNLRGARAWTSLAQEASYVAVGSLRDDSSPGSPRPARKPIACVVSHGQAIVIDLRTGARTELGPTGTDLAMVSLGVDQDGEKSVVWAVDAARQLWRCELPFERWEHTSPAVTADAIAATPDGGVFRLSDGELWAMTGTTWAPMGTPEKATSVGAGFKEQLWIVGESGKVYEHRGSDWVGVPSPASGGAAQISCGQDFTVWLALAGRPYSFDIVSQRFVEIEAPPSGVIQASVSTREHALAIDAAHNLFCYTMDLSHWQPLSVAGLPPVAHVASDGRTQFYALDDAARLWAASADDGAWAATQVREQVSSVAPGADGTVWITDTDGAAYQLADGAWQLRSKEPALVSISAARADQIVALDRQGVALRWSAGDARWNPLQPQATEALASISIAPGQPLWAVTREGRLLAGLDGWIGTGADQLEAVSAGPGGDVWAIDRNGTAVELIPRGGLSERSVNRPRPKPSHVRPHWDAEDPFDENQSTHLWIVNRAARLARRQGELGRQICDLIAPDVRGRSPSNEFHNQVCQGLYDADFKSPYNDNQWAYHFFDPDTKKNYLGQTVPTAMTMGVNLFVRALNMYKRGDKTGAGYNLGLSLHYLTDLTQPMHAANFTEARWPMGLHGNYERAVMAQQNQVPSPTEYRRAI